jgi:hypothetical protein
MHNRRPVLARLAGLAVALVLSVLALPAPSRAFSTCFNAVDLNCYWTGGGYCLHSGCSSKPSYCSGSQTGTVTCHTSLSYPCCVSN